MSYIDNNLAPGEIIRHRARVHPVAYLWPLVFLLGMMWPGKLSGLMTTRLVLTDKQVIGKMGLVKRRFMAWPYTQIDVVRVQQGWLGVLLDYGTVILLSKDGNKIKFNGIAEPFDIQMQVEEAVEKAVLGRTLSRF